jgi:hypothetical protein
VLGVKVLYQHKAHAGVDGQRFQQFAVGTQAASRSTNAYDREYLFCEICS